MDQILYDYELNPTTWVYVSSLMTIAIFFRFNRLFSIRNFDLLVLLAMAPGPLLVARGAGYERIGYAWLFAIGGVWLVRLLADPAMVRRPLLEPNLSAGGLTFMDCSLFLLLMMGVLAGDVTTDDLDGARRADGILERKEAPPQPVVETHRPGYPLLHLLASVPSRALVRPPTPAMEKEAELARHVMTAKTMAILSHLAVVLGIVTIGVRHFGNLRTGIAAAGLYLLTPYSAQMVGRVDHALPAALLVWAVAAYRRPMIAGILLGVAAGTIFYPVFLLPLWLSFYWQRGRLRFVAGVVLSIAVLVASLTLTSSDMASFNSQLRQMVGWPGTWTNSIIGFWAYTESAYRITATTVFVVLSLSFALWPAQKNLGTLISCSAVVMLGAQFWNPQDGGLYIAWYLPLLILTIFRPNLEDRVAIAVLSDHWLYRRRPQLRTAA
jgi:hypothetical protein